MDDRQHYLELLKRCLAATLYDESAWMVEGTEVGRYPKRRPWVALTEAVRALRRFIGIAGLQPKRVVVRCDPFDKEAMAEGRKWPLFGYTMIGEKRLTNIQECMETCLREGVAGDFMEAGVWRGGATIFMRAILQCANVTDRKVWVADSFAGLPPAVGVDATIKEDADLSGVDYLKVSLEQVRANFARFGLLDSQVEFLKGWFAETLPKCAVAKLAVLRVDGDMYHSTMDVLNAMYDRVSDGGFVIIDDYPGWEGCRRAVEEFRAAHGVVADMQRIDWTGVYWRKGGGGGEG